MFDKTKIYRSKNGISYQYHGKIETDKGPMHRFKSNKNAYPIDIDISHNNIEAGFKRHFGSALSESVLEESLGAIKKFDKFYKAPWRKNKSAARDIKNNLSTFSSNELKSIADNEKKSGGAKKLQSRLAARLLRNKNRESSQMKTEDIEAATNFLIAEGYEVNEENIRAVLEEGLARKVSRWWNRSKIAKNIDDNSAKSKSKLFKKRSDSRKEKLDKLKERGKPSRKELLKHIANEFGDMGDTLRAKFHKSKERGNYLGGTLSSSERKSLIAAKIAKKKAAEKTLLAKESSQMKTEDIEAATDFLIAEGYEVNEENLLIVLESDSFKRDDGVETIQESTADRYAAWISQKSAAHRNSALVGSNELNESHNDKDQQTFVPK